MPLPDDVLEALPEEYRDNETLKRFNNVADLAKSYVESRSKLGRSITIPSEHASEDDRKEFLESIINNAPNLMLRPDWENEEQAEEFYKTWGRPDDPNDYELPEDVKLAENAVEGLKMVLHQAGLNNKQFKAVMDALNQGENKRLEMEQEKYESATSNLKKKWGMAFEERLNAAQRINEQFYPGRDFGSVTPTEIEALYSIHAGMTGKPAPGASQDKGATPTMTPGEAIERADEMLRKAQDQSNDLSSAERQNLVKKSIELKVKYAGMDGSIDSLRAGARGLSRLGGSI